MTEIRIYEEHNKVVVCREKTAKEDKLHELVKHALDWQDDTYEYYRLPLDEFMNTLSLVMMKHLIVDENNAAQNNTVE